MINFAMNPFSDADLIEIDAFLDLLPDDFNPIVVHSQFEQKSR